MKKTMIGTFTTVGAMLFVCIPVFAAPLPIQQIRKEIREEKQEMLQNMHATKAGILVKMKAKAVLLRGTVTAKGADSLTVLGSDGKTYAVGVDATTQWRRKFWGKSDFNEVNINDVLNIHGKWVNDQLSEIQARLIRNISIQKRNGVFFGEVKTINATGWIMSTNKRGDQTVTITGSTRLIDRKEIAISQSSIGVGHKVRVKGLWDSKNNTITEVTQVKDFDLPVKSTPTPMP